jgi:hypothetical protein
MKKNLLLGLLALALLVIPGVVSAATTNEYIYGTIPTRLEIWVYPSSISYGTMVAPNQGVPVFYESGATVYVNSQSNTPWTVDMADQYTPKGYMKYYYYGTTLINPMRAAYGPGETYPYHDLTSDWTGFWSGVMGTGQTQPVYFNQTVDYNDAAGSYSITVTFTIS